MLQTSRIVSAALTLGLMTASKYVYTIHSNNKGLLTAFIADLSAKSDGVRRFRGCISLLLPRLPKLPRGHYSNGLVHFGSLGSCKEAQIE